MSKLVFLDFLNVEEVADDFLSRWIMAQYEELSSADKSIVFRNKFIIFKYQNDVSAWIQKDFYIIDDNSFSK